MLIDAGMSSQRVVCVVCNLKIIIKNVLNAGLQLLFS